MLQIFKYYISAPSPLFFINHTKHSHAMCMRDWCLCQVVIFFFLLPSGNIFFWIFFDVSSRLMPLSSSILFFLCQVVMFFFKDHFALPAPSLPLLPLLSPPKKGRERKRCVCVCVCVLCVCEYRRESRARGVVICRDFFFHAVYTQLHRICIYIYLYVRVCVCVYIYIYTHT